LTSGKIQVFSIGVSGEISEWMRYGKRILEMVGELQMAVQVNFTEFSCGIDLVVRQIGH